MTPEPPASLPFAEALECLCDQALVSDFLKADQLLLETDQLVKRLKNPRTGARATTLNGNKPVGEGEIVSAESDLRAKAFALWCDLDKKMSDLWDDLAARVSRGEFHLQGRPAFAGVSAPAVVIWCSTTNSAMFRARANTVEVAGGSYEDVCAVLGPAPSASEAERRRLPLPQALSRWCDPWQLLNIRRIEAYVSVDEIVSMGHLRLGTGVQRKPPNHGPEDWQAREWRENLERNLQNRWAGLTKDLKTRIADAEIHLYGVQTSPNLARERELIPATWAFDLEFNFGAMSVAAHGHRWTAVECWLDPADVGTGLATQEVSTPTTPTCFATLKPEDVHEFSDELILALLEENHRRVLENPDARPISPAKVSWTPLLKRKMRHRAAAGEIMPNLASEASALAAWLETKVPSHQVPGAKTIENALRLDYASLRPRSNPIIP